LNFFITFIAKDWDKNGTNLLHPLGQAFFCLALHVYTESLRGSPLSRWDNLAVDIQGGAGASVPHLSLNAFDVGTRSHHPCGTGSAQRLPIAETDTQFPRCWLDVTVEHVVIAHRLSILHRLEY
jgi:hypothetical protein